jgi:hypothetical protein
MFIFKFKHSDPCIKNLIVELSKDYYYKVKIYYFSFVEFI